MADKETDIERARSQAKAQYDSIVEMVYRLRAARDDDTYQEMAKELAEAAGFRVVVLGDDVKPAFCWAKSGEHAPTCALMNHPDSPCDCGIHDEALYEDEDEAWLACCDDNDLRPDEDEARQAVEEDALSVQVRSGWGNPGETLKAEEFEILLCTGGPAVRIVGELDDHGEPDRPRLECQDWFTPWTEAMAGVERDTLQTFCECFYFGEG